jgi:PilZ domain
MRRPMGGSGQKRVIAIHAPQRAFGPGTLRGLARLDYEIVSTRRRGDRPPDAIVAAGRELRRLPADLRAPIVYLERRGRPRGGVRDLRIVETLRRPASLGDLYRALQLALESNPRRVPRVAITLPARCATSDGDWPGAIVSLSEGGCLVRSAHPLASRRRFRVWFPLPETGLVEVTARPLYERRGHLGLAFLELADATRRAIANTIEGVLES